MPTIVVQNDHILRALKVILDPDCPKERSDAFADYYSVDMPEFPQWCTEIRKRYPAVAPANVVLVDDQDAFVAALGEADGVVVEDLRVGPAELDKAPNLRIVQNFRTDMRNLDEATCAKRGIACLTFHRQVNMAVGEHAFALMMALAKKVTETNKLLTIEELKAEGWPARVYDRRHTANSNWARISGIKNMFGSTIGIIGLGSVGRYVANWANAFGMRVVYTQRSQLDAALEAEFKATYLPVNDLFAQSDFISIHVPLNESTRGMIGAEQLNAVTKHPIIVNIARADIIQRDALLAALDAGTLGGVGMDVHYKEPGDPDDPFLAYRNVIMSPHIAIGTRVNGAHDMEGLVSNLAGALG